MKKTLFCIIALSLLWSCSSNDEGTSSNLDKNGSVKFLYNGKSYESNYKLNNDGTLILDNQTAAAQYQKIQSLSNLATYVNADESLTFYDTYKDLAETLSLTKKNNSTSKSANQNNKITFYHDINNAGTSAAFPIFEDGLEVPDISIYNGFNDKISSFIAKVDQVNKYNVTLFRDKNFEGASVTFPLDELEVNVTNLRNYTIKNRFPKKIRWNDQMSSFKITVNN